MVDMALASGASDRQRTSPGVPSTAASRKTTRSCFDQIGDQLGGQDVARDHLHAFRQPSACSRSATSGPIASSPRIGLP
jgi:hypothetical protein